MGKAFLCNNVMENELIRTICRFTLDYDAWIEDNGISPYTHKQAVTFHANTFSVDDILRLDINGALQRKYNIVIGNRIGTNGVMFYATIADVANMVNVYGSVYYDSAITETVYQQ